MNKNKKPIESSLKELEQLIIGFNPNTDKYEYGQLFYSKENGYEVKNKNDDLLTNKIIQKANDDYFRMKNTLNIIKEKIHFMVYEAYFDNKWHYFLKINNATLPEIEITETEYNELKNADLIREILL